MKNRRIAFLLCAVLSVLFLIHSSAHSGGTDANGGHYKNGEYHYHHGYPAHQHVNGKCPYDFDDRKGETKISNGDIANQAPYENVYVNDTEAFAYAALGISISAAALVHRIFKR